MREVGVTPFSACGLWHFYGIIPAVQMAKRLSLKKVTAKNSKKLVRVDKTTHTEGLLPPPVGTSDWARFSRDSYCVDKTLILKDLIDSKSRVVLFTRPRRFGKTTMLEMIRAFYEGEVSLFRDKKIWAAGAKYRKEQGKHPVIFLSFKDVKWNTFGESIKFLNALLAPCVGKFAKAVEALELEAERDRLLRVMREQGDETDLSLSLGLLSKAVHAFTKRLPVILIDEYDQPITSASTHGYYDEMCTFMRVFLSGALKDNKHCHIGIMTGVLRVAKEGILRESSPVSTIPRSGRSSSRSTRNISVSPKKRSLKWRGTTAPRINCRRSRPGTTAMTSAGRKSTIRGAY